MHLPVRLSVSLVTFSSCSQSSRIGSLARIMGPRRIPIRILRWPVLATSLLVACGEHSPIVTADAGGSSSGGSDGPAAGGAGGEGGKSAADAFSGGTGDGADAFDAAPAGEMGSSGGTTSDASSGGNAGDDARRLHLMIINAPTGATALSVPGPEPHLYPACSN